MAFVRAIFVAISLVVLTAVYSEISNYEEELANRKTSSSVSSSVDAADDVSNDIGFKGISVQDIELKGESGSFQSPNFPTAANNLDYTWFIKVPAGNAVRLVFIEFDTEAENDYVFVYDGATTEHPLLLVHSGKSKLPAMRSSGNEVLVRFVTNNKIPSKGFQANYYSVPPCFGTTHLSSGVIESPNFPLEYDNNLNCEWLITVGRSEVILFEFHDVNTEKDHDVIQVFDGDSDLAPFLPRVSGNYEGKVVFLMTTSNTALVRFTSDKSIANTGFLAKFYAGSQTELLQRIMKDHSVAIESADDIADGAVLEEETIGNSLDAASTRGDAEEAAFIAYLAEVLKRFNETEIEE